MQLEFTIENQRLSRNDKNFVVEKSQNYLYSHFDFTTNDWDVATTRYAIFTNEKYNQENALMVEIDLETNTCLVPYQILLDTCSFHVNVVGVNSNGEYIITTNESNVIVAKINTTNGIHPDEPQPSFLHQLFEKVSNSYNNFKFVYNETDGTLKLTMIDNDGKEFSKVVDLPMEQVVKNVSYNENTSTLTIEWINGQKTEINFEQFIKSYSADEITLTLSENNTFSIKQEWINEINQKIGKLEEHSISDLFYERITASDSTSSKYEIENGSIARPIKIGGMTYKSDNLQPRSWVGLNDRIELNTTLKEGQSYTVCVNLPYTTGSRGLNLYDSKNNLLFSNESTGWTAPNQGWNSFVIIAVSDTTSLRINAYGFEEKEIQGAIYSGALVETNKYNAVNIYTPYFEGLRDTAVTGILSKGNNLLDINNIEIGSIGTDTGNIFNETTRLRNADFINVIEGNTYCFTILDTIYTFKSILLYNNGKFIKSDSAFTNKTNVIYEIPSNINQIKLIIARKDNANITTFNDLQCMIIKDKTAPTEYEPYWEERFEISSAIQNLEGYGKGINETYNNYIDYDRKVFVQNVMEVDLGELRWEMGTSNTADIKRPYGKGLENVLLKVSDNALICPIVCEQYNANSANDNYKKNKGIAVTSVGVITIYDENYNTADSLEAFKEYIKGVKAIIPLAEPIETDISDLITEFQYKADNIGTETLLNEYEQKAYAEIGYSVSLGKQIIENSNNISKKLDKVTSTGNYPRVYAVNANGSQEMRNVIDRAIAWAIPYRNQNNNFMVGDLTASSDGSYVANKNYVDNTAVANKNYVDNIISKQAKRIEQLEKASQGTILETLEDDTQVSYVRQFDEDTLPYSLIEKVGGMTYKSNNLIVIEDKEETTSYGITYTIKNGVITLNGTATKNFTLMWDIKIIKAGSCYFKWWYEGTTSATVFCYLYNVDHTTQLVSLNTNTILERTAELYENSDEYAIYIPSGAEINNLILKPMLVYGTTAPTEFKQGFEGLRDTAVTGIVNNGANLISLEDVAETTLKGVTYSIKNGVVYMDGTPNATTNIWVPLKQTINKGTVSLQVFGEGEFKGHNGELGRYSGCFVMKEYNNFNERFNTYVNDKGKTITTDYDMTYLVFYANTSCSFTNAKFKPMLVQGSTIPTEFNPYREPTIKEIPSAIQNIDGYGLGINETYYNYIDFERKVFVQNVMEVDLGDYAWYTGGTNTTDIKRMYTNKLKDLILKWATLSTPAPILCEGYSTLSAYDTYQRKHGISIDDTGSILIYDENYNTSDNLESFNAHVKGIKAIIPLETPIETDISDLLAGFDNVEKLESLGSLTFENEYGQAVPNSLTYQRRL